jgi:hypothetical protein
MNSVEACSPPPTAKAHYEHFVHTWRIDGGHKHLRVEARWRAQGIDWGTFFPPNTVIKGNILGEK